MGATNKIYYTYVNSGLCSLYLASSEKGICRIDFEDSKQKFFDWIKLNFKDHLLIYDDSRFNCTKMELEQYFNNKRRNFTIKVDMKGTPFQRKVWDCLMQIPYGKTVSYKQVAGQVGGAGYSRAVGNAANKNPIPIIIPCHRVIGADGNLTGFAGGLNIKEKLLELERKGSELI